MDDVWAPVGAALERAAAGGRTVEIWLRDDDAVTATGALERLTGLARDVELPILLAVIPGPADRHLARFVAAEPLLTPTQHGFMHENHAGPDARACELGGRRTPALVLDDLARGRDRMRDLFPDAHTDILVPPWNRIAPELLPHLPSLGFGALSTFADLHAGTAGLDVVNCNLDIIDWRNGRVGHREDKLVGRLATLIDSGAPVGLLTHHLAHDAAAWRFLERALPYFAARPEVRFTSADHLRSGTNRRDA